MKKHILTMALATTVLFSGICATYAGECTCQKGPHHKIHKEKLSPEQMQAKRQAHVDKFENAIGLTDEQKAKTKEIRENAHNKIKPLFDKKLEKMKVIKEIRENDDIAIKVQDKKIEAIMAELKSIDQDIRQVKQDERKAFKAILTDEQKAKLKEMREAHKKQPPIQKPKPMPRPAMY